MKILALKSLVLPLVASLTLGGCMLPASWNPMRPKVISTENQFQPHETWCYQTLAEIDCYPSPQNFPPDRLVNVYPQSRYPMTPEDYRKTAGEVKETP